MKLKNELVRWAELLEEMIVEKGEEAKLAAMDFSERMRNYDANEVVALFETGV